jgi:hypothetical protein
MMRSMTAQSIDNQHLPFKYGLADSWFSSSDNMLFIRKSKKYFLTDMKSNRLCMFATDDRNKGRRSGSDQLPLTPEQPVKVWPKDPEIPVLLCKPVFTNRDGSTGETYPVRFASLLAYVKLERFKFAHRLNHFALKAKIYLVASKAAWNELYKIKYTVVRNMS